MAEYRLNIVYGHRVRRCIAPSQNMRKGGGGTMDIPKFAAPWRDTQRSEIHGKDKSWVCHIPSCNKNANQEK